VSNKQAAAIFKESYRYVLVLCLLLVKLLVDGRNVDAQTEVKGLSYAPNVFYQVYDYLGDGNEYASQVVNLQYPSNNQGGYQFSVSNEGTSCLRLSIIKRGPL